MTKDASSTLPRIYADANDQTEDGGYMLVFEESRRNIADFGAAISPGVRVILNVQDELEMEATLGYDDQNQIWIGYPDYSTIRYLS